MEHATKYFFDYSETRRIFTDNFILCLTQTDQMPADVINHLNDSISKEGPIFVVESQDDPRTIENDGRLVANPNEGLRPVNLW
ncbi:MAG: hypothetical protein OXC91_15365, partial [Rhodobacteraceae bacterium]|nr:hypothetical protein [Paracoccaceae bacterium]